MSTPAFTAENIEKALHQLYYDSSLESKDIAQQWLTKAQRAAEAWQFSWELLQDGKATEVQYFGASALTSKIAGAWSDIPTSEVLVLRNRLFEQILRFCVLKDKRIVLTRLCVAFAAFLTNCAAKQLWPTAISDIIEKFQNNGANQIPEEHRYYALLEILTIIAEEFLTTKVEKYKRGVILHLLKSKHSEVLNLLIQIFQNSPAKSVQARIIKCFSSWISLGIPFSDCEQLLVSVFDCVKDPELFDPSVECLLSTFCSPATQDYPNTIKKFMPLMVGLQPLFQKAVSDQDGDAILGLTKVVCSLAENFPKLIIETFHEQQYGMGVLCFVLDCCRVPLQYPTEEWSSPISFTFWCSLQDEIEALSSEERVSVCAHLNPYFYELVNCLLIKACYPKDDSYSDWTAEEKEMHRVYRIDVSDALMYVLDLFGINLFLHLFNKLQISLQQATSDPEKQWHDIEVCLFGLHSVIESLTEFNTDIPHLQTLAELLPTISVSSLQLADTMLYIIGTLTEWLNANSSSLLPLASFVLKCLSNQDLALSAVLTMRRLVRECCDDLIPYAVDIMQHFTTLLIGGTLQRNVEVWLMQAAGHVLAVMPRESCLTFLEKLLEMHLHQFEALSKDPVSAPNKTSILHIIDLLANLFCTLDRRTETEDGKLVGENEEQPVIMILTKLNSIIQNILNTWITDKDIVDALCQMYEKAIRSLVEDFAPVVVPVSEILCAVFNSYPYACVMNLSQQVMLVFGSEEAHLGTVLKLFHCIVTTVLPIYRSNNIKNHPDIAQDFMRFLGLVCKKRYRVFEIEREKYNPSIITDLVKCAIMTLQMAECECVSSGAGFLLDLIALSTKYSEVAAVVDASTKNLLLVALQAIGGASPRTTMERFADILSALANANFPLFNKYVDELMKLPNVPCATVGAQHKSVFAKQLVRDVKRKQKIRDLVKEFTLVCRGLHGTGYVTG